MGMTCVHKLVPHFLFSYSCLKAHNYFMSPLFIYVQKGIPDRYNSDTVSFIITISNKSRLQINQRLSDLPVKSESLSRGGRHDPTGGRIAPRGRSQRSRRSGGKAQKQPGEGQRQLVTSIGSMGTTQERNTQCIFKQKGHIFYTTVI